MESRWSTVIEEYTVKTVMNVRCVSGNNTNVLPIHDIINHNNKHNNIKGVCYIFLRKILSRVELFKLTLLTVNAM